MTPQSERATTATSCPHTGPLRFRLSRNHLINGLNEEITLKMNSANLVAGGLGALLLVSVAGCTVAD